jgi:hypothetical protein
VKNELWLKKELSIEHAVQHSTNQMTAQQLTLGLHSEYQNSRKKENGSIA